MQSFRALVSGCRNRDSTVVLKSFQKILEGPVDTELIQKCLSRYTRGASWNLIGGNNFEHTADWANAESVAELQEELNDRLGKHVCIVAVPDYISDETSFGAYAPDEDGVVRLGAY